MANGAVAEILSTPESQEKVQETSQESWLNTRTVFLSLGAISAIFVSARLYQQVFAWAAGLDSFHPDFQTYWMNVFYAEIVLEGLLAAGIWGWLWKSRDQHLDQLQAREELKRYFSLLSWLLAYVFIVYFAASLFAEQDATWHQTVVRDTSFTPSHIFLFYGSMPAYIIVGVGSFLYARTRLPKFANEYSVPFVIAVAGPLMILPNVGFNEWGHSFWIMEELFSAPVHYGFVVLGWTALALGGLLMQIVPRIVELAQPGLLPATDTHQTDSAS